MLKQKHTVETGLECLATCGALVAHPTNGILQSEVLLIGFIGIYKALSKLIVNLVQRPRATLARTFFSASNTTALVLDSAGIGQW